MSNLLPFVVKFEHRHASLYLLASPLHDSNVVCVGTKRIIFAGQEKTDKRCVYKTQTIDVSPTPGDKDGTENVLHDVNGTQCPFVVAVYDSSTSIADFIRVIVVIFDRCSQRNALSKILNDAIVPVELYKVCRATDFQSYLVALRTVKTAPMRTTTTRIIIN